MGNVQKRPRETGGWLETEGSEVQLREAGRPVRGRDGVHVATKQPKSRPDRSQSVHRSQEVPVMGMEQRDAGRWMECMVMKRVPSDASAVRLTRISHHVGLNTVAQELRVPKPVENSGLSGSRWHLWSTTFHSHAQNRGFLRTLAQLHADLPTFCPCFWDFRICLQKTN